MRELRCGPKLFGKITDDGLIEIACPDCRKDARRLDPAVILVLHCYKPDGTPVPERTRTLSLIRHGDTPTP